MFYLVTNQKNEIWTGQTWGENVSHYESNFNYQFCVYQSPLVASFMSVCYEGIENPKLWNCVGETNSGNDFVRLKFMKLTTITEEPIKIPTTEQRITFGLLASLSLVNFGSFVDWAKSYLSGKEFTDDELNNLQKEIMQSKYDEDNDLNIPAPYTSPCTAILLSTKKSCTNPGLLAANAAHRAWGDSTDEIMPLPLGNNNGKINLHQLAQIALTLPRTEIVKIL